MAASFAVWLLISISAASADLTYYIPQLTSSPIAGKVTTSTFVLDKPQCIFNPSSSNTVYVVVANYTAVVTDAMLSSPVSYSPNSNQQYYHTFQNPESFYSCNNIPDYIRIGNDPDCTTGYCNKPLSMGPYKVIFVVLDSSSKLTDKTAWSGPITLRKAKDSATIDTWPGGRSGGMIVITSILSVLLAAYLISMIGTFIVARKSNTFEKPKTKEQPVAQVVDMKNYKLHNVPESGDIYAQPLA